MRNGNSRRLYRPVHDCYVDDVPTEQCIVSTSTDSHDLAVSLCMQERTRPALRRHISFTDLLLHYVTRALTFAQFRNPNPPTDEQTQWTIPLLFLGRFVRFL